MGQRTFTVSTVVPAPPADCICFLADLTRHRGLHPFLVSSTQLVETTSVTAGVAAAGVRRAQR